MCQMFSTTLRPPLWVRMEQKSRSKFLPLPRFEPPTSHLAVQHATARPPRTPQSICFCHMFARYTHACLLAQLLPQSLIDWFFGSIHPGHPPCIHFTLLSSIHQLLPSLLPLYILVSHKHMETFLGSISQNLTTKAFVSCMYLPMTCLFTDTNFSNVECLKNFHQMVKSDSQRNHILQDLTGLEM